MAISIKVDNIVKFKVKGTIKDGNGIDQPFDFSLTCKRLDADQQASLKDENGNIVYVDFMEAVIQDWSGVKDGNDENLPYTAENWRALAKVQGVAQLAWLTYMRESGAKEKN